MADFGFLFGVADFLRLENQIYKIIVDFRLCGMRVVSCAALAQMSHFLC